MSISWGRETRARVTVGEVVILAILTTAATVMLFMADGCRYRVNSNNPKVILANDLNSAARATDLVADGLVAANIVIESLKTQEPEYYAKASKLIVELARLNDQAIGAIQNAKAGGAADWRGALLVVAEHASTLDLAAVGIKNPERQKFVKIGLASLTSVLESILASFKKGQ